MLSVTGVPRRVGRPTEGLNHVCDDPATFDNLSTAKYYASHRKFPEAGPTCRMSLDCLADYTTKQRNRKKAMKAAKAVKAVAALEVKVPEREPVVNGVNLKQEWDKRKTLESAVRSAERVDKEAVQESWRKTASVKIKREELNDAIHRAGVVVYCFCGGLVSDECGSFCQRKHDRLCDHDPRRVT